MNGGTGTRIANEDKKHTANMANIAAIQSEMNYKAATLKSQIGTNPGLKPVFKRYMDHVNKRRADAIKILQHLRSLLISLNSLTLPDKDDEVKLQSDQKVIEFEINRWNKILSELNAVDDDASIINNKLPDILKNNSQTNKKI